MGYSHFDSNEEEVMESFLHHRKIKSEEIENSYPEQIKSLLRKKMLEREGDFLLITSRGESAINQQIKTGEYWVSSLKPFVPSWEKPTKIKVEAGMGSYFS